MERRLIQGPALQPEIPSRTMATETRPSGLLQLPNEIIAAISAQVPDYGGWTVYKVPDEGFRSPFNALRLTSRKLYDATQYEFFNRLLQRHPGEYSCWDDWRSVFQLAPTPLWLLWRFSEMPPFQDRIRVLRLEFPKFDQIIPGPIDEDESYAGDPNEVWSFAGDPNEDWSFAREPDEEERHADHSFQDYRARDDRDFYYDDYERSPEAFYFLTEIFRNLRNARNIETIEVSCGYDIVLNALEAANFKKRIVVFDINTWKLRILYPLRLWTDIPKESVCLKKLRVKSDDNWRMNEDRLTKEMPTNLPLSRLLDAVRKVDCLEICGCCQSSGGFQSCDRCLKLVESCLALRYYPRLRTFNLHYVFAEGGLLRSFLSLQSDTLVALGISDVLITSCSWKGIFKTLKKASSLESLQLARLFQKPRKEEIETISRVQKLGFWDQSYQVQIYEEGMSQFLSTIVDSFKIRLKPQYPAAHTKYSEVSLPIIEGVSYDVDGLARGNEEAPWPW